MSIHVMRQSAAVCNTHAIVYYTSNCSFPVDSQMRGSHAILKDEDSYGS